MSHALYAEFAEKHDLQNGILANIEYLSYAKANKLNPGWSKLIIRILRQNCQNELADQLQPNLNDKTAYDLSRERENLRRMRISSNSSNSINDNVQCSNDETYEITPTISSNVATIVSLPESEFRAKC